MPRPRSDRAAAAIRAALLRFFDESARALPWRRTLQDPYAIWISEVMAQQTRVETVIPYYERWLLRFPDVATLAEAPLDDVLKAWEGLGYYSRARHLHAAARVIRERHGGAVPAAWDQLRALPGVGDYTAGAVASIAFGAPHSAVDGNVRRVLARVFDVAAPRPAWLRDTAARLLPHDRPGDFNQALMELGATVCTPRAPACRRCPLAGLCAARAAGTQLQRPTPRRRPPLPLVLLATAVLRRADGRVLLARRPPTGLLAGLWAFPATEVADETASAAAARTLAGTLLPRARFGRATFVGAVDHTFSHRRERYHCWTIPVRSGAGRASGDTVWIGDDRTGVALPRAQQRIHALACSATGPAPATGA